MKKVVSIILALTFIVSMFSMISFADESSDIIVAVSDTDTSDIIERFSLSSTDDGRVEVDKSVNYKTDLYNVFSDYSSDEFSVELSAIGQSYTTKITEETETSESMHLDVMFVVDVSSSMYTNNMADSDENRVSGTVQALNVAINTLVEADPEVRFGIVCYGTNVYGEEAVTRTYTRNNVTASYEIGAGLYLPVDNYSLPDGETEWITYSHDDSSTYYSSGGYYGDIIATNANLKDGDNNTVPVTQRIVYKWRDGTYTQAGLVKAVEMFTNVEDKENRVPALVLITDGIPTLHDADIYPVDEFPGYFDNIYSSNTCLSALYTERNLVNQGTGSAVTNEQLGITEKTAIRVKSEISSLYPDADAMYFTIGPGIDYEIGKLFLDPSEERMAAAEGDTTTNSTEYGTATADGLRTWLMENLEEEEYTSLVNLSDFSIADNFTVKEYEEAMEKLVGKIINKSYKPVSSTTETITITPTMDDNNYIKFVDNLDNMTVTGAPVIIRNGITYEYTSKTETEEYTEYKYSLNNVAVFVYNDKVVWIFRADLLPLISGDDDTGYTTASPIRCVYKLGIDCLTDIDEVYYTNSSCVANYTPAENNPYYKNYSTSTLYKTTNETSTKTYVNEYTKENNEINVDLGNNGKIYFNIELEDVEIVLDYGLPVEYTITDDEVLSNCEYNTTSQNNIEGKYGIFSVDDNGKTKYEINTMKFVSKDKFNIIYNITKLLDINASFELDKTITYIPAKIIYFEEDFVTFDSGWTKVGTTKEVNQNADILGDENSNVYGYDAANSGCMTYSLDSAMVTTVTSDKTSWSKATFSFVGTGFDIISRTDNESGWLNVTVTNAETGKVMKKSVVYNHYDSKAVEETKTDEETGEEYTEYVWYYDESIVGEGENALYQIPVMRIFELPYGEYNVTIQARWANAGTSDGQSGTNVRYLDSEKVYLDAIRIYSPSEDCEEEYIKDDEYNANIINIHNAVNNLGTGMFIDGIRSTTDWDMLLKQAPNNEIYLQPGQSIAFSLDADNVDTVQISAKALFEPGETTETHTETKTREEEYETTETKSGTVTATTTMKNVTINGTKIYYKKQSTSGGGAGKGGPGQTTTNKYYIGTSSNTSTYPLSRGGSTTISNITFTIASNSDTITYTYDVTTTSTKTVEYEEEVTTTVKYKTTISVTNDNVTTNIDLNSTHDMYYKVNNNVSEDYVITNTGDKLVSITNIKVTYNDEPVLATMSAPRNMMMCMSVAYTNYDNREVETETIIEENIISETIETETEDVIIIEEVVEEDSEETNNSKSFIEKIMELINSIISIIKNLFK